MPPPLKNSNGTLSKLLLAFMVPIVLALGAWVYAMGERVTRNETRLEGVKESLVRIERKQDAILARLQSGPAR